MNGYAVARQNGWMSANDIRELEDMNRIPAELGGDLYLVNGNMTRLADAGAFAGKNNAETEGSKVDQITKSKNRFAASGTGYKMMMAAGHYILTDQ